VTEEKHGVTDRYGEGLCNLCSGNVLNTASCVKLHYETKRSLALLSFNSQFSRRMRKDKKIVSRTFADSNQGRRWRYCMPTKRRYLPTSLQGVTTQKTNTDFGRNNCPSTVPLISKIQLGELFDLLLTVFVIVMVFTNVN
jgi:hypothetical protein